MWLQADRPVRGFASYLALVTLSYYFKGSRELKPEAWEIFPRSFSFKLNVVLNTYCLTLFNCQGSRRSIVRDQRRCASLTYIAHYRATYGINYVEPHATLSLVANAVSPIPTLLLHSQRTMTYPDVSCQSFYILLSSYPCAPLP